MSQPSDERGPKTQPVSSGRPPLPTSSTTRHPARPVNAPGKPLFLLDQMTVKDLAAALRVKPFKVIADLMELKHFKTVDDNIDFETASLIARKHGYRPEKPPPGMLVL